MISRLTISQRLIAAFSLLTLLTAALGWVAYQGNDTLAAATTRIFRHPFTVTNGLADANAYIIEIRSTMKDIALVEAPAEIDAAEARVNALDQKVREQFDLVRERFLGDKKMVEEAVQAYEAWKPVRAQVIQLAKAGRADEAKAVVKGEAARQMQIVQEKMSAVRTWAQGRAAKFMETAEATRSDIQKELTALLGVALATSILAGLFITRSIAKPIVRLTGTMAVIAAGDGSI